MKHSIKRQIAAIFICISVLTSLAVVAVNRVLLPQYYFSTREECLKETRRQIMKNNNMSGVVPQSFQDYCVTNNISVTVTDQWLNKVYSNVMEGSANNMVGRIFVYYFLNQSDDDKNVLEATDSYVIQRNRDPLANMDFLEMWGALDNGFFIARIPVDGIQTAVDISNQFYFYIAIASILIGTIVIWLISSRVTRPLTRLTEISQKMANLEFDAHYETELLMKGNEIDILGNNFNKVSETLEQTISELKAANNELQRDIEQKQQIDEMRKEFISNVSHELKTPIALIQGYAEGLQDNIDDGDAEMRQFYCDVIMDEAGKMNKMVKKLLTLNHLEFGNEQVDMTRFDLTELIHGILQSSELLISQKEAKVIFDETEKIYVWGDEFKVEEVVTNYLTNALNHLKYDKIIEIRCRKENGIVRTSVFNTGDPIPEEDLDKIWIKFYKVDKARTREYGGSGIGLSIVKAIMELMHQKCGVQNFENGVEFWFTLENK